MLESVGGLLAMTVEALLCARPAGANLGSLGFLGPWNAGSFVPLPLSNPPGDIEEGPGIDATYWRARSTLACLNSRRICKSSLWKRHDRPSANLFATEGIHSDLLTSPIWWSTSLSRLSSRIIDRLAEMKVFVM